MITGETVIIDNRYSLLGWGQLYVQPAPTSDIKLKYKISSLVVGFHEM